MGKYSSDSDSDREPRRRKRSRSHSSNSSYSSSRRKHKHPSRRRKHSTSRSRSGSRIKNSRSRSYSRSHSHKKHSSYSRSKSRSRSRERNRRKHGKHKHKRRHRSSSSSEREKSKHKDKSKRSISKEKRKGSSKQRDSETIRVSTPLEDIKESKLEVIDLTESEKLSRDKEVESIESNMFIQKSFLSTRSEKVQKVGNENKDENEFNFGTNAEIKSRGTNQLSLGHDSLFSPHLFGNLEEREEKYIRRIFSLRQKAVAGEPMNVK